MLAPGMVINASNRVVVNSAAGNAADFVYGGYGFKNDGSLALNTNAPTATAKSNGGIAVNNSGSIFVTTSMAATDVWISGLRVSASGQLVVEAANGVSFVNGNPLTAAGVFATT